MTCENLNHIIGCGHDKGAVTLDTYVEDNKEHPGMIFKFCPSCGYGPMYIDDLAHEYQIQNLTDYIKKDDLVVGQKYECDARNFSFGTWNGSVFTYIRYKFGSEFEDEENHYDDGAPHGTVKPFRKV